jgi:hypothetical protein
MFTILASNKLPRTVVKPLRRSWSDRITGGDFLTSHQLKKVPFVLKIDSKIFIHPENAPAVRRYLELHNLPYKDGEISFEPPKTEASLWCW